MSIRTSERRCRREAAADPGRGVVVRACLSCLTITWGLSSLAWGTSAIAQGPILAAPPQQAYYPQGQMQPELPPQGVIHDPYATSSPQQQGFSSQHMPHGVPHQISIAPAGFSAPVEYSSPGEMQTAARGPEIQQVQLTTDPRRPLDSRIMAMPRANMKLEVIHHRSQLVVTRNRLRRIAWSDPGVIDVVQFSENEISILGLALGSTDLQLWFEGQEAPLMYVVTVIKDPSLEEQRRVDFGRIERKLALLYPNSKVYLIPMSRKIIVRGQARDPEEAAKIMQVVRGEVIVQDEEYGLGGDLGYGGNGGAGVAPFGNGADIGRGGIYSSLIVDELQVPGEYQVSIRVRIAALDRSQLRRLGVDWSAIFDSWGIVQTLAGGAPTLTGIFNNGQISVLVDALASNGTVKVMEDARLTTLSGEPAAFLAGGEFAVPTIIGIAGAQGQSTSFRGFGTSVICTPTLIDHDLIRLQIVPELSSINNGNSVQGIPGVNVRRVQTRVELREGQTIVLGGLFSRREATENTRIPFIGEIPIVGNWIFNAKRATEDENELLIIVTPELVRAMDPDQVPPMPGWYVTHPDDCDFYKYNRTEGNPDLGNYQLLPYGNGHGYGKDVGYNFFNPAPVDGRLAPAPTGGAVPPTYAGAPPVPGIDPSLPAAPIYQGQPGYPEQVPSQQAFPQQPVPQPGYPAQSYPGQVPQPGYPQPQPGYVPQTAPGGPQQVPTPPPAHYPGPPVEPTPATTNRSGQPAPVQQASGNDAGSTRPRLWRR